MDSEIRKALTDNLAVPVKVASLALGAGEYATYSGIRAGEIPSIKVGRKLMVPTAPLRRLLGIEDGSKAVCAETTGAVQP